MTPPSGRQLCGAHSWFTSSGGRLVMLVGAAGQPLPAGHDLRFGRLDAYPGGCLDFLAGLERLVHLKEMLDLELVEIRDVHDVPQVRHPRVRCRNAEHLVIRALLITRPEHADGTAVDLAAGERRLLEEHERVKRVSVVGEGVLNETVISWIAS